MKTTMNGQDANESKRNDETEFYEAGKQENMINKK